VLSNETAKTARTSGIHVEPSDLQQQTIGAAHLILIKLCFLSIFLHLTCFN